MSWSPQTSQEYKARTKGQNLTDHMLQHHDESLLRQPFRLQLLEADWPLQNACNFPVPPFPIPKQPPPNTPTPNVLQINNTAGPLVVTVSQRGQECATYVHTRSQPQ